MLRSARELKKYSIQTLDNDRRRIDDLLFDDFTWIVRYLSIDTGVWLPGRLILISPASFKHVAADDGLIPVSLTTKQIEDSPSLEQDKPVSRQKEEDLARHYAWSPYWLESRPLPASLLPELSPDTQARENDKRSVAVTEESKGDPHLRSAAEVTGYKIRASDDAIGHVEDLIVDDDVWAIRYMVIDTNDWLPGKHVLLASEWLNRFDWNKGEARTTLKKDQIENSPIYDPSAVLDRSYETALYTHYKKLSYWDRPPSARGATNVAAK